jgi:hypothetical protein
MSGAFISRQQSKGEFSTVFSAIITDAIRFFPTSQPALEDAQKGGLPTEVLESATAAISAQ